MDNLIKGIASFISRALTLTLAGTVLALLAGEVKLAALRKASQGSSKLSVFTQRMTKIQLKLSH